MRVLVTGATGFVGRAVVDRLLQGGHSVVAAVRQESSLPDSGAGAVDRIAIGEVHGGTDWTDALEEVDSVIHLVARTHRVDEGPWDQLDAYRAINVEGTRALARQARAAGVGRIVFASSVKVNGERTHGRGFRESDPPAPEDAYGQTKLEAERALGDALAGASTGYTVLRPPVVYGPGVQANIARLACAILTGRPLPLGRVHNRRSFIGVRNLADALVRATESPTVDGAIFLVSDGVDHSTAGFCREIAAAAGRSARLLPVPAGVLRAGLRLAGRGAMVDKLLGDLEVDDSAIRLALGWAPPNRPEAEIAAMVAALRQPERPGAAGSDDRR